MRGLENLRACGGEHRGVGESGRRGMADSMWRWVGEQGEGERDMVMG